MSDNAACESEMYNRLFLEARSYNGWQDKPVTKEQIDQLYSLTRMGPTAFNGCPARFIFLQSQDAKDRLAACVSDGNVHKVKTAPVVVIVAMDVRFFDKLEKLFPHDPGVASYYIDNEAGAEKTAFRNGSLQGAYLMMAARAMGLDCGPMSGFDPEKVTAEFLADEPSWRVNFLCAIGYGDPESLFPRSPRLDFDEACKLL